MIDVRRVLDRLNIAVIRDREDEVLALCPGHEARTGHPDNSPSWWINTETGQHICFSCGFKGGIYKLISEVTGFDYDKSKEWVGDTSEELAEQLRRYVEKRPEQVFKDVLNITEASLAAYVIPPFEALKSRGLTLDAVIKYQILWDRINNRWIIPIRDPITNELKGWQEKGYYDRFFNNYPTGMKKSVHLFGYQQYKGGQMIAVESPLDAVRLASVGIEGGVATFGASVSESQIEILRGADKLVIAMDNDSAGKSSSKSLYFASNRLGFNCWFFDYSQTDQKDVGGMSKAEIEYGINNSINKLKYMEAAKC